MNGVSAMVDLAAPGITYLANCLDMSPSTNDNTGDAQPSNRQGRKRKLDEPKGKLPRGGGEDGSQDPSIEAQEAQYSGKVSTERFACPFFKKYPLKYKNERPCLGPGWEEIRRLK